LAFATSLVWRLRIGACGVGACDSYPTTATLSEEDLDSWLLTSSKAATPTQLAIQVLTSSWHTALLDHDAPQNGKHDQFSTQEEEAAKMKRSQFPPPSVMVFESFFRRLNRG